jgi:hypothetical protein
LDSENIRLETVHKILLSDAPCKSFAFFLPKYDIDMGVKKDKNYKGKNGHLIRKNKFDLADAEYKLMFQER